MSKYGLPKYVCFDVRTSLCSKKVKFDITLVATDGKRHSTKTNTIKEGLLAVIKNRIENGIWTNTEAHEYFNTYDVNMESKFTLDLACQIANVNKEDVLSGQYYLDRYKKQHLNKKITALQKAVINSKPVIKNIEKIAASSKKSIDLVEYFTQNPQWALIANFPDFEIYSQPYLFTNEYGVTCWTYKIRRTITKRELKPSTKGNSLYINLNGVNKAIYKLAADTFIHNVHKEKDNKLVATEVHHKNGDDTDNRLENLIHVTKAEHVAYHKQLNTNKTNKKFTATELAMIKGAKLMGASIYEIAAKFNCTVAQARSAVNSKAINNI